MPLGFPKKFLYKVSFGQKTNKVITNPKVVWESLTYPNVACLGGIVTNNRSEVRDILTAALEMVREARIAKIKNSELFR